MKSHIIKAIVAQYAMLGIPQQNGVVERRNRTLMDMVRSIISNSQLLNEFQYETRDC